MHTLSLSPPAELSTSSVIHIGNHAFQDLKNITKDAEKIVLLFDEGIRSIAENIAKQVPDAVQISVASGDASKSLSEADRIVSEMLDNGCNRRTLLVAVGGGMLTDLAGFIAGIFMRGIDCILVPTTLLGMVDAAIGGKTALNVNTRKNMIGTITHPAHIIIDTSLLQTLPLPQLQEGLAEMIKIAAITDAPFFEWLEDAIPLFIKRDAITIEEAVLRAVSAKVKIVEQDERDRDVRLLLNFGHTVGHAVEALSGYTMAHGRAVSIGVVAEMRLSGFAEASRVEKLLVAAGLPVIIPPDMKQKNLWKLMESDKKNEGGEVRIAVPKRMGEGVIIAISNEQCATLFV